MPVRLEQVCDIQSVCHDLAMPVQSKNPKKFRNVKRVLLIFCMKTSCRPII